MGRRKDKQTIAYLTGLLADRDKDLAFAESNLLLRTESAQMVARALAHECDVWERRARERGWRDEPK